MASDLAQDLTGQMTAGQIADTKKFANVSRINMYQKPVPADSQNLSAETVPDNIYLQIAAFRYEALAEKFRVLLIAKLAMSDDHSVCLRR